MFEPKLNVPRALFFFFKTQCSQVMIFPKPYDSRTLCAVSTTLHFQDLMFPKSCVPRTMSPEPYVPRLLCSQDPVFPKPDVLWTLCSQNTRFPEPYFPRSLCSWSNMFPKPYVTRKLLPKLYVPRTQFPLEPMLPRPSPLQHCSQILMFLEPSAPICSQMHVFTNRPHSQNPMSLGLHGPKILCSQTIMFPELYVLKTIYFQDHIFPYIMDKID